MSQLCLGASFPMEAACGDSVPTAAAAAEEKGLHGLIKVLLQHFVGPALSLPVVTLCRCCCCCRIWLGSLSMSMTWWGKIGEGTYGVVYLATSKQDKKQLYAIKKFKTGRVGLNSLPDSLACHPRFKGGQMTC